MVQSASSRRVQTSDYIRQLVGPDGTPGEAVLPTATVAAAPDARFSQARARGERLIAVGRLGLALFAALAVRLDPPADHAELARALTVGYLLCAVPLLALLRTSRVPHRWFGAATHAADLTVAATLTAATAGSSSPFFVLLIFAMLSAAVRWGASAVVWTGTFSIGVFLVASAWPFYGDGQLFSLNRFLIRMAFLAVVTLLLAALTEHHDRLQREIARLAEWPRPIATDDHAIAVSIVTRAAAIVGAPRVALVVARGDDDGALCVIWTKGETAERTIDDGVLSVSPELAGRTFLATDLATPKPAVLRRVRGGAERVAPQHVPAAMIREFAPMTVVSAPIESDPRRGRLFVLDKRTPTIDDLELTDIVAKLASAQIAHTAVQERLRAAAVIDERVRLARDLHDGILQSLTAAQFQLETSVRQIRDDPDAVERRLRDIQRLIEAEQRELRALITDLRPGAGDSKPVALADRLNELRTRVERHWGLQLAVRIAPDIELLAPPLKQAVYWTVHEAVINSARHARGHRASVALALRGDRVCVSVDDDGQGFPFRGRLTLRELLERGAGPRTLIERVAGLAGSLTVDSTRSGSRIEIEIPSRPKEDQWPSGS